MAVSFNIVSNDPATYLPLSVIRQTFADLIKAHVDPTDAIGVRIYPHWVYEIDPYTMLGKATAALKVTRAGSAEINRIHCWTIGTGNMTIIKGFDGVQPPMMGAQGGIYERGSMIDVWGFFHDDGDEESQARAENEARLIQAAFQKNLSIIRQNNPQFSRMNTLDFSAIARSPFADGSNVIVASGAVQTYINEALS